MIDALHIASSVISFVMMWWCLHFLQPKPRIDYTLKAVGGSLTAIPGLSDMIDVSFEYHFRVFTSIISMIGCYISLDSLCFSLSNGLGYCEFHCNGHASMASQDGYSDWWHTCGHKVILLYFNICLSSNLYFPRVLVWSY